MKLSELIDSLIKLKDEHGDLPVRVDSLSHSWQPEPEVKTRAGEKVVILNP